MSDDKQIEMSPTIGALAAALAKAQGEMKDAAKDGSNPAFKGSKYSTLSAIREAVREPFSKNGLSYTQYFEPHGFDAVCLITLLMHASGEWIKSRLVLPVTKKDPQGFGSAITYGRRYQLAAIAGVTSDDDDDGNAAVKPAKVEQAPPAESDVDVAELVKSLETAPNVDALAKAILAVGRVKDKLSKQDLAKCQAAREERVRQLEAKEKAA
jgi:hypothetical protein